MNTAASATLPKRSKLAAMEPALWVGVASVIVFFTIGAKWLADLSSPVFGAVLFFWVFLVMLWLSFRAVHHAEEMAHVLGEPYGTLILTLAVICIEVAMVVMVTLTGHGSTTLARDTMFAVLMVVLNGMIGLMLLTGGLRHHEQSYNLSGATAYLSVLLPLAVLGLVLPRFTPSAPGGEVSTLAAVFLAVMSAGLYGVFLLIQTTRHAPYFRDASDEEAAATAASAGSTGGSNARILTFHATLLIASLLPLVLLSKKLAILVHFGVLKLNAPEALGGLVVAALVLAPEGVAGFRAAMANQLQRTINILFGAALSTIGLTIPAVLVVDLIVGGHLVLGLDHVQIVLLCLTLGVCVVNFAGRRTTVLQGAVHLVLFVAYLMLIFD
jgi:Ca2+:H+ antiporter